MSKSLSQQSCPRLRPGVRLQFDAVRQHWVLLAPERVLTLDSIGASLIQKLNGQMQLARIAADCASEYDAPLAEITNDILGFVQTMIDKMIVEL